MATPALTTASQAALAWTPIVAAAIVVGVRIFVRAKLRTLGTEDWLMVLALAWALISASLAVHLFYAKPASPSEYAQLYAQNTLASFTASLSITFAKASVGFLLLRLLGPTSPKKVAFVKWSLGGLAFVQFFQMIAYFIPSCAIVKLPASPTGCLSVSMSSGYFGLWNIYAILIDIAYSTLPITFMYRLNMRKSKTVAATVLLSLGWVAAVFTLVRTIGNFHGLSSHTNQIVNPLCTVMEQALVMIAGSLATLLPLYQYISNGKPLRPRGEFDSPSINRSPRTADYSTKVSNSMRQTSGEGSVPSLRVDQSLAAK